MKFSLIASWKKDVALNSYIFCLFLIGLPFTIFGNYVIYQLQVVGFLIGVDVDGQPCVEYCLVPFGTRKLDLNSVLLYLNAMGFGLGGFLSLIISAYADYWSAFLYHGHWFPDRKRALIKIGMQKIKVILLLSSSFAMGLSRSLLTG
jgi:hypothetical protein